MSIIIYSKDGCVYCDKAVELCNALGVTYKVEKVSRDVLKDMFSQTVYPQIIVNGKHIGGFFEFEEMSETLEPILIENPNRFTIFPLRYHTLWDLYKKAQMSNWTAEEIDLSKDVDDWAMLKSDEKHFISHILAFFAASDGIVFENISVNFAKEVQIPEARSFYAYQEHNEMVHGETYSKLIDKYITNPIEKDKLFRAIQTIPCVAQKAEWAIKWFSSDIPFARRLVAFACVEGIFFSGSFCAIFWLKKRGLMPGLTFSNELISRDEGLHTDFAVLLHHKLKRKLPQEITHSILREAYEIEAEFITDSLPCRLIGMNSDLMKQYIRFVTDHLLESLGYDKIWNEENPFDFMENISLKGKTNFFEKRVAEYKKARVGNTADENQYEITDDF